MDDFTVLVYRLRMLRPDSRFAWALDGRACTAEQFAELKVIVRSAAREVSDLQAAVDKLQGELGAACERHEIVDICLTLATLRGSDGR